MSHEENIYVDHNHGDEPETKSSNLFVRIVVIIGIILILLFIALTIVKYVPKLLGAANVSFSSLFSPKDKLSVSVTDTKVKTGDNLVVNWKNNTTDTDGSYMWSFKCVSGVEVLYNSISGLRPVICDTLFPLPSDRNSYSFLVKNANKVPTEVPMSVTFWDKELSAQKFAGSTSITVLPEGYVDANSYAPNYANPSTTNTATTTNSNSGTKTTTSTSGSTYTGNTNTSGSYGNTNTGIADLRVSLYKIGRTTSDGGFQETTSFAENDRVTVRFNVSNIGTARSGTWSLTANLPTKTVNDKVFNSGAQPALNPGDSFELTISFDTFDPNGKFVQITMSAYDTNQSNNSLSIPVSFNGNYNGGSGSNYNSTGSKPDLVVRIIDVGVLGNNNQFYYDNSLNDNDTIAVRFEVQNIGGSYTGNWRFEADLPTMDNDTFRSNTQNSLAPGEIRQFTIGFDNPDTGSNNVTVNVDSDHNVSENSESNNDDSERIYINN
jgi:hypothetical protein